jgi:hypothetical protein
VQHKVYKQQKTEGTCSEIAISGLIIEYLKFKFVTFFHVFKAFSAILFEITVPPEKNQAISRFFHLLTVLNSLESELPQ